MGYKNNYTEEDLCKKKAHYDDAFKYDGPEAPVTQLIGSEYTMMEFDEGLRVRTVWDILSQVLVIRATDDETYVVTPEQFEKLFDVAVLIMKFLEVSTSSHDAPSYDFDDIAQKINAMLDSY